jgi:flagellar capping protein FliD
MVQGIYAYNSIYNLLNISRRDLKNTSTSPASIATSMLFGTNLNQTYSRLIDYDAYEDQASFYDTFRSTMTNLKDSAKELSDPNGDAFATRDAEFESDAISVTAEDNAEVADYTIEVEQVASTQSNESEAAPADEKNKLTDALNHIEIGIEGEVTDIHIERTPDQTNEELFENIANSINEQDLGITARVATNESGEISVAVTGNESGEGNDFTIEGGLAEAIGLNVVDTVAQDAILNVDNEIITSNTNLVELDGGKLGIKINAETTIPFDLHIEVSGRGALSAAKTFANNFNEAMTYLQGLNNVAADLLQKQIMTAVSDHEDNFEELGITMNKDNKLVVDEEEFNIRFEDNEAEAKKILTKFRSSVNQVERRATQALETPPSAFRPSPNLPAKTRPYNFGYNQNRRPVPVNSLFTSGSIIDVFF